MGDKYMGNQSGNGKKPINAKTIVQEKNEQEKADLALIIEETLRQRYKGVKNEKGVYVGGFIIPGMNTSLNALTANASQLQGISLDAPNRLIGKNTIECMKSGMIYGTASMLDGIVERVEEEFGQPITAIATGGLAKKVVPFCKKEMILDDDLLLKGLRVIYNKNKEHMM